MLSIIQDLSFHCNSIICIYRFPRTIPFLVNLSHTELVHKMAMPIYFSLFTIIIWSSSCLAAPRSFTTPLYISDFDRELLKRVTSADPSCPPGWLCNSQTCPSTISCPDGYYCIDFEGSAFCAPNLGSQGSYCSLDPDTLQGVACAGDCWYVTQDLRKP